MVDLAKIRKKAKKATPAPEPPPAPSGGEDAARSAGETPALRDETPALHESKLAKFMEQAGKRRVAEAARVEQATTGRQLELLTFVIAGEQYAVDIERIVEIVRPRPVTRIPNAEEAVTGIISLRGTIVTLVDVRRKLGHPAVSQLGDDARIVVIDFRTETVGFVVDRVLRVVKIEAGQLEPHPVVHAAELEESIRGVFRVSNALTILLDLDKLLDHSRWT
jgi:purine-binding chemotaxis protein CheW